MSEENKSRCTKIKDIKTCEELISQANNIIMPILGRNGFTVELDKATTDYTMLQDFSENNFKKALDVLEVNPNAIHVFGYLRVVSLEESGYDFTAIKYFSDDQIKDLIKEIDIQDNFGESPWVNYSLTCMISVCIVASIATYLGDSIFKSFYENNMLSGVTDVLQE